MLAEDERSGLNILLKCGCGLNIAQKTHKIHHLNWENSSSSEMQRLYNEQYLPVMSVAFSPGRISQLFLAGKNQYLIYLPCLSRVMVSKKDGHDAPMKVWRCINPEMLKSINNESRDVHLHLQAMSLTEKKPWMFHQSH